VALQSNNTEIKKHNYKFTEGTEENVMTEAEQLAAEKKAEEKKALELKAASDAERKELTAVQTVELFDVCKVHEIDVEFAKGLVEKKVTFEEAKDAILTKATDQLKAIDPNANPTSIKILADAQDKKITGFSDALMVRSGLEKDAKVIDGVRKEGLRGLSLHKLAQRVLMDDGMTEGYMLNPQELFEQVIVAHFAGGATQGSGDFVNVLSNVLNKSVAMGWNTAPSTFEQWVGTGELKDFKQADLVRLSEIGDVERIREGEAPEMSKMTDMKEQARPETFGSKIQLTRQAMIDDDLAQLTSIPQKKMRALKRKMNKQCYGTLYDGLGVNAAFLGPNMIEGTTDLFNATAEATTGGHNNLVAAAGGGVPTQASLNAGFLALAQHRALTPDSNRSANIYMNVRPEYILIGANAMLETYKLFNNLGYNVSGEDSAALGTVAANIHGPGSPRHLTVVSDVELDFINATYYPWYLAANPLDVGTITLYTLTGNTTPFTDTAPTPVGNARGMIWVIEHDFVFAAPDWRGLYCNSGPTK